MHINRQCCSETDRQTGRQADRQSDWVRTTPDDGRENTVYVLPVCVRVCMCECMSACTCKGVYVCVCVRACVFV